MNVFNGFEEDKGFDEQGDQKSLALFIGWLNDLMNHLLRERREEFFIQNLNEPMLMAWESVGIRLQDLEGSVLELRPEELEPHGLIGNELKLKLKVVRYWSQQFLERNGGSKSLILLLKAVTTILQSILEASKIGKAITEFMEMALHSIEGRNQDFE